MTLHLFKNLISNYEKTAWLKTLRSHKFPGATYRVAMALYEHAFYEKGIWPTQATIGTWADIPHATGVNRALRDLKAAGVIVCTAYQRSLKGSARTRQYWFVLEGDYLPAKDLKAALTAGRARPHIAVTRPGHDSRIRGTQPPITLPHVSNGPVSSKGICTKVDRDVLSAEDGISIEPGIHPGMASTGGVCGAQVIDKAPQNPTGENEDSLPGMIDIGLSVPLADAESTAAH